MHTERRCAICGTTFVGSALNGLCPQCLLGQAVAPTPITPNKAAATEPAVDPVLGDFEILGTLAEGGMGIVYYARQISLNRAVALKMIRSGHLASPVEVQRFRTEAEAAATLDHPHIVPIHEIGEHKGRHYFTMKLLDGGDLAERLQRGKPTPREAAAIAAQLALAVHHAHERGILHRDIKPTNVVLDETGQPHLTDFGLAKVMRQGGNVTQTQVVLGTPAYMAPEQASGTEQITTAADIYSLGAVLYEMLSGRPPFKGASALEILSQVRDREPERLIRAAQGIDHDLEAICFKCLEKSPAKRYSSARALAEDLENWLAGKPIHARPATPWVRTQKWSRRNPAIASLMAVSAALLLAGITGVVLQWRRAETHARKAEANAAQSRQRLVSLHVANGVRALESGDSFGALTHFAEGYALDRARPETHRNHQLRLTSVLREAPRLLHIWFAGGPVHSAEFSNDGALVLASAGANTVLVWRTRDGALAFPPIEHSGARPAFAQFSPSGDTIVSAGGNNAHLWSARDGALRQTFAHDQIHRAAMSFDGKRLATTGGGTLKVWDASATNRTPMAHHSVGDVISLEFSADAEKLLVAGKDGTIRVLNFGDDAKSLSFNAGRDVRHAAFNFNATRVVTARSDGSARVWNAATGEPVSPAMKESTWLTHAAFSPDGKWMIASAGGHRASVWDAETGKRRAQLGGHNNVVVAASFSPGGQRAVTASFDGTARVYEVESGRRIASPLRHGGMVTAARFHPDGQRVLTASADGTVRLWSLWPTAQTIVPGGEENVAVLGSARNGALLLVQTPENNFEAWDTSSWQPVRRPIALTNRIFRAWLSADGARLVTLGRRGDLNTNELIIELRDGGTGKVLRRLSFVRPVSDSVAVSPDAGRIVLHGRAGLELYDPGASADAPLASFTGHAETVRFSPDSRAVVVTRGADALVIDLSSGKLRFPPIHQNAPIRFANFSPDSRRLVTCARDHLLEPRDAQIWDAASGQPIGAPLSHGDGVFYAAFSPDSETVVTASEDGTARVWSAATGRALAPPLRHAVAVHHASFSPDGKWIATASLDKSARIWDADTGEPLTPLLNHDWRVDQADILAGGRYLLTLSGYVATFIWDLSMEARPPDDVIAHATLLSGHTLDATGALAPVSADELRVIWKRLNKNYPHDFAFGGLGARPLFAARDARLAPGSLDISQHYNASLSEAGNPTATNACATPEGAQTFDGVQFDVRGIVQLAGGVLPTWGSRPFPEAVKAISVPAAFRRIHILHGTAGFEQTGKRVASLLLHYTDGEMREIPILAGKHTGDWQTFAEGDGVERARPVWSGRQIPSRVWTRALHWYKSTWENPRPGHTVSRLDYVSAMSQAAPYLVAVSIEPGTE